MTTYWLIGEKQQNPEQKCCNSNPVPIKREESIPNNTKEVRETKL